MINIKENYKKLMKIFKVFYINIDKNFEIGIFDFSQKIIEKF